MDNNQLYSSQHKCFHQKQTDTLTSIILHIWPLWLCFFCNFLLFQFFYFISIYSHLFNLHLLIGSLLPCIVFLYMLHKLWNYKYTFLKKIIFTSKSYTSNFSSSFFNNDWENSYIESYLKRHLWVDKLWNGKRRINKYYQISDLQIFIPSKFYF